MDAELSALGGKHQSGSSLLNDVCYVAFFVDSVALIVGVGAFKLDVPGAQGTDQIARFRNVGWNGRHTEPSSGDLRLWDTRPTGCAVLLTFEKNS